MSEEQTAKDNEELTEVDYQTITTIVLGWFFLWNMIMKQTPEDYAEKVFLKIGKSKKKPSSIRLLFDMIREKSNSIKSPDEFNQTLAREMLDQSVDALKNDMRLEQDNLKHLQRYLDSRRMSEVLRFLRDRAVLGHLEGKQDIQKEMRRLPGRVGSHSFDTFNERFGGKPSGYKKTYLMERLSSLYQKPKVRSLVYAALKETNILYEVERFMLSAFYIALKRRKHANEHKNVSMTLAIVKATDNNHTRDQEIKLMLYHIEEQIANLNEHQVKQWAADKAKESIERLKDDANFLGGLFRY